MPMIACTACPLRKHALFAPLSAEDVAFMQSFKTGEMTVDAGTTVLLEGSTSPQLYTVLSGLGTRSKTLEDGRRQVINFLFPGDFVGLQAGLLGEMKHSVEAATPMRLCAFRREDIWNLFRKQPERAYDLTWLGAVEEHFLGETIATLGQRDAAQRLAWALLRIHERLRAVDLVENGVARLPFRQQDLADALGLSLVHTNKTLRVLRDQGLASWADGRLRIDNPGALADLALVDRERPDKRPLF